MVDVKQPRTIPGTDIPWPPGQDDLPYDDGMPMPTFRHVLQMQLLMGSLRLHWAERSDVFIGGDMFVYYSPDQVKTRDFLSPDVFVVLDVPFHRVRKSWVVWEEYGRSPDVVIELLSDSTARGDRTTKWEAYQRRLRVPEYIWYDPYTAELAGFALRDGVYEPMPLDEQGRLISRRLGLLLVPWQGEYAGEEATWLRWATPDGTILPTGEELAGAAQQRAEAAQQQAEAAERHAEAAERRAAEERERAERAERRMAELEARLARLQERPDGPPGSADPR
jgi:Uma2 family endonuclease